MAMLAAPRRKQKVINLRAKNSDWSNDTNKFGQRMLEKMGWSSGKGLGAKENGIVEHVVARYKNDDKGLGFEDKNDQWTKHEDDFNTLLANLSNGDSNEDKLHSGVSLEVKSKKSKARVHYHKFTRGKDLTRYSEKDLANIFGKKSLKQEEKEQVISKDDVQAPEPIFTEKGSMEDYFKGKMAAFKTKSKVPILENKPNNDEEADFGFRGFSGTNNDESETNSVVTQSFSFYPKPEILNLKNDTDDNPVEKFKKKKKKKSKCQDKEIEDVQSENVLEDETIAVINEVDEIEPPRKKSKKKKHHCDTDEAPLLTSKNINYDEKIIPSDFTEENSHETMTIRKKKKKKNKNKTES